MFMRRITFFILLFLCVVLGPRLAFAASSFEPAFKTLGVWDEKNEIRIDLNIWYPTYSRPSPSNYAPWTLRVVRYGRAAKGRFPLLLLSHDTTATRFSYHETAAELAKSGFVVVAPAHKNDNLNNIAHPFSLQQLTERSAELINALQIALTHDAINKSVDPERVGIVGFGMGASAALLLGNAKPTKQGWDNYCKNASSSAQYCGQWAKNRIQKMIDALPLKQNFGTKQVQAIAAIAPSYGMLFDKAALQDFSAKLLLMEAEQDSVNLKPWNTGFLLDNFPKDPDFVHIEGVDTADLMSVCPQELRKSLAELCGQAPAKKRIAAHKVLNNELIKFFLKTLGQVQTP